MIKVSVLITTYNLEKYIAHTLEKVLEQQVNFNFEILIGDDGSDDDTLTIVEDIRKTTVIPIKIFKMKRNNKKCYNPIVRASRNRYNLMKHARGQYINFLDGDDFYLNKNMLQILVDKLDQYENCSMCAGDTVIYKQSGMQERVIGDKFSTGFISLEKYWKDYWIHAECFLFRNCLKKGASPYINRDLLDDNLITYYFMRYGTMYYVSEPMVAYRQNLTSWKRKSIFEKNLLNSLDVFEENRFNTKLFWINMYRHCDNIKYVMNNYRKYKNNLQYLGYWESHILQIPWLRYMYSSKKFIDVAGWYATGMVVEIMSLWKKMKVRRCL